MNIRLLFILTAFFLSSQLPLCSQYSKNDSTYRKHFVGSTMFILGNFAPVNPPEFGQLNLGYRLTHRDVISLELITWKYEWPLGINPFLNESYGDEELKFPGSIRDYGVGLAFQRFLWKGLYLAAHVMPMLQTFKDDHGNKLDNGFHIFNTFRVGYHVKLFKDRWFIQPSLGIAGRPYHSKMPDAFKQMDDRWPKYTPEPGLHFGYNF